ncbi:MAG: DUF3427 domain-containing protein [Micrococcaceae bacterium]
MEHSTHHSILSGFQATMIDQAKERGNELLTPDFIDSKSSTIFNEIDKQITACNHFKISVAFITLSGVQTILGRLSELKNKNITGQILTCNYLYFTEPEAIRKLNEIPNVEVRIFETEKFKRRGFHAKTYAFYYDDHVSMLLGSSNLTGSGLRHNVEWNNKLYMSTQSEYLHKFEEAFDDYWKHEDITHVTDEWLASYTKKYESTKKHWKSIERIETAAQEHNLKPNTMQQDFIKSLKQIQDAKDDRALLISATGTGKTYAAAFAVKELRFKKVLFVAHREQIVDQARKSFATVFDKDINELGKFVRQNNTQDKDMVFTTVQTMQKPENYQAFPADYFDLIIVDEAHRIAANSYQKILNYFKPKFMLGLTATPERTDNPELVYEIFQHNIAGEIRLQDALAEDLICPFHYYGIADIEYQENDNYQELSYRDLNQIQLKQRAKHIINQAKFFGYSGKTLKGLVFCSTKKHAKGLAAEFAKQAGFHTKALTGEDSSKTRNEAIASLQSDDPESLDYIFTVDLFNEGVNIPEVNQVIMVRPTESAIIFVQQLGRGLRKSLNKDFVVVIDIIGNYQNDKKSYLIPIALTGSKKSDKDTARRITREANKYLTGESTIWLDEISDKRIFNAIAKMTFGRRELQQDYRDVRMKIGKTPTLLELDKYGSYAIENYLSYFWKHTSKTATYFDFVKDTEPNFAGEISNSEQIFLEMAEQFISPGKRYEEIQLLKLLLKQETIDLKQLLDSCKTELEKENYISATQLLDCSFYRRAEQQRRYHNNNFLKVKDNQVVRTELFSQALENPIFKRFLANTLALAEENYQSKFANPEYGNFKLYEKYSRRDVSLLLRNKTDNTGMYGYPKQPFGGYWPLFVTYKKNSRILSMRGNDKFLNESTFLWQSRKNTNVEENLRKYGEAKKPFLLFIQRDSKENDTQLYFVGASTDSVIVKRPHVHDKNEKVMSVEFKLEEPVRQDIYDYLTSE